MGMDAELLAIGKFTPEVASHLDYPKEHYKDTPIGSTIITSVMTCVTSDSSKGLAEALGISPWNYEEHCELSGEGADEKAIDEVSEQSDGLARFLVLRRQGFKFYYMPNY